MVKIIQDFIPETNRNWTGLAMHPEWFTIHETGNRNAGANARMHAIYIKGPDAEKRGVGWHVTVDDGDVAYQHLPFDIVGWHATDGYNGTGNRKSVGLEICINSDADRVKAYDNAAWITAYLLHKLGLTPARVRQHSYWWTSANCPRDLRAGLYGGWEGFMANVRRYYADMNEPVIEWAVLPATQKVFPDTAPDGGSKALLHAARDEYVSFQVALRSDRDITLSLACSLDVFEVLYIDTPRVASWGYSGHDYTRTVYPDPLLPAEKIKLKAGETKALWIRARARVNYQGQLTIGDITVPVEIRMWPWEMPDRPSLKTSIGLGGPGFARYYGTAVGSERYRELYDRYYEALLEYRLSAYHLPVPMTDPYSERYITDDRVTTFRVDRAGDMNPSIWQQLQSLQVEDKAWVYNFDEPTTLAEYAAIAENATGFHARYSGIKYGVPFYRGAREDSSTPFDHLAGALNLWIPQTDYYQHGHGVGDKVRRQAAERKTIHGEEVWLYTALAPRSGWCNILLNHTALEHRSLFWQIWSECIVTGYIYWHSTYWNQVSDPWTDQETLKQEPGLWGDGSLFYPGENGPCGSVRLELIRAGLQDYELLQMAAAHLERSAVEEMVERVTRSFTDYNRCPDLFEQVRLEIGGALAEYIEGSPEPEPEPEPEPPDEPDPPDKPIKDAGLLLELLLRLARWITKYVRRWIETWNRSQKS